jgi:hypothetical protein
LLKLQPRRRPQPEVQHAVHDLRTTRAMANGPNPAARERARQRVGFAAQESRRLEAAQDEAFAGVKS